MKKFGKIILCAVIILCVCELWIVYRNYGLVSGLETFKVSMLFGDYCAEYIENSDVYTIDVMCTYSLFPLRTEACKCVECENEEIKLQLYLYETIWGKKNYEIRYISKPAEYKKDGDITYLRNDYHAAGNFEIDNAGNIISGQPYKEDGERFLDEYRKVIEDMLKIVSK